MVLLTIPSLFLSDPGIPGQVFFPAYMSLYQGKCSPHMCHPTSASVLSPPTCVILPGQVSPSHMCISSRASIFPPHLCHSSWPNIFSPPPLYRPTWTDVHPLTSVLPNMSHYLGSSAPSPSLSSLPLPSPGGARAASSSACAGATNTAGRRARPEALHAGDDTHSGAGLHFINCLFL